MNWKKREDEKAAAAKRAKTLLSRFLLPGMGQPTRQLSTL